MFGYAPTVNDMSGQIMGQGMADAARISYDGRVGAAKTGVDSAQVNAQMMRGIGENIGQALMAIGSAYKDYSDMKSSIKSGEKMLDVLGPAIGMTTEKLKTLGYNDMKDREKAQFFNGLFGGGLYASAAQAINFGNKLQVSQNAPYVAAGIKNQQNIAGGNVPHGSGVPQSPAGMAPVEPDLPVGDEYLPAVQTTAPSSSVPGGDESMRRYNEWKRQRGY